jgi:transcriptional regulator with XRE-family HTH domain
MTDSPDITFGHRLRVTRIAFGISEQEVADILGVSLPTYRKYERGDSNEVGGVHHEVCAQVRRKPVLAF